MALQKTLKSLAVSEQNERIPGNPKAAGGSTIGHAVKPTDNKVTTKRVTQKRLVIRVMLNRLADTISAVKLKLVWIAITIVLQSRTSTSSQTMFLEVDVKA